MMGFMRDDGAAFIGYPVRVLSFLTYRETILTNMGRRAET